MAGERREICYGQAYVSGLVRLSLRREYFARPRLGSSRPPMDRSPFRHSRTASTNRARSQGIGRIQVLKSTDLCVTPAERLRRSIGRAAIRRAPIQRSLRASMTQERLRGLASPGLDLFAIPRDMPLLSTRRAVLRRLLKHQCWRHDHRLLQRTQYCTPRIRS